MPPEGKLTLFEILTSTASQEFPAEVLGTGNYTGYIHRLHPDQKGIVLIPGHTEGIANVLCSELFHGQNLYYHIDGNSENKKLVYSYLEADKLIQVIGELLKKREKNSVETIVSFLNQELRSNLVPRNNLEYLEEERRIMTEKNAQLQRPGFESILQYLTQEYVGKNDSETILTKNTAKLIADMNTLLASYFDDSAVYSP